MATTSMSTSLESERSQGTFTVLDIMLFVAASSMSIVLIRMLRPPSAMLQDYVELIAYCGPAGLSVFGPWAVRRQFLESNRDELWPGEWLWIVLGGSWLAATPLAFVMGGQGVEFFAIFLAVVLMIPAAIALLQSLGGSARRPWTHWAGIALCLLHAAPAFFQTGPVIWTLFDRVFQLFEHVARL
jgi:hypothetical protein